MINRKAIETILGLCEGFPLVDITGPRQSGKTTLVSAIFADRPYASLEDPDIRAFAGADPRAFLARYPDGVILDEVQRCPDLFSYLPTIVDRGKRTGLYVLAGSQKFGLRSKITQSLAGRVGMVHLLSFGHGELAEQGGALLPAEIKAGRTVTAASFVVLNRWRNLVGEIAGSVCLVHAGDEIQQRTAVTTIPRQRVAALAEKL